MKKILFILLAMTFLVIPFRNTHANDQPYVYPNDVENPSTLLEIKQHLIAVDEVDGELSSDLTVQLDNYSGNEYILGDFIIIFEVTDSNGQTTDKTITVRNLDLSAPEINLSRDFNSVEYGEIYSDKLPQATCVDGYQGDVTDSITTTGTDSVDVHTYGEYQIIYTCSDGVNETTKTFSLHVIDSYGPEIYGMSEFHKNQEYIASVNYFVDHLGALDNIDGDLTSNIEIVEDGYTGNGDSQGTYVILVGVTDSFGNRTTHEIKVHVRPDLQALLVKKPLDNELPIEMVISTSYEMTDADFTKILVDLGFVSDETYSSTSILNTYSETFDTLGTALYRFKLISPSGVEEIVKLSLEKVDSTIIVHEATPSGFQKIWTHVFTYGVWYAIGVALCILFFIGKSKKKW